MTTLPPGHVGPRKILPTQKRTGWAFWRPRSVPGATICGKTGVPFNCFYFSINFKPDALYCARRERDVVRASPTRERRI